MKRFLLLPILAFFTIATMAQVNLQLHYDFGRLLYPDAESTRPYVTSTVEFFKADKLGNNYFFVDMDYYSDGMGAAYWEVYREFNFAKIGETNHTFAGHIEYDGGLGINKYTNNASRYQHSLLVGPAWSWNSNDYTKTVSVELMYKQYFKQGSLEAHPSFQLTGVWSLSFAKDLCTFAGYFDICYCYIPKFKDNGEQKKGINFSSEPQFWFNIIGRNRPDKKFSVGTELEYSVNMIWPSEGCDQAFFFNPTLAVKYIF